MILFLHNRYRTTGGEERVVADLLSLVRERLHERAELLGRDSATTSKRAAAGALVRGGAGPDEVAAAVKRTGARIVHAHNLHPSFGWRALAAAKAEGARVVLHLHQYRLVCAVGVCFTGGQECVRCHGRNTLPGILRNCRASGPEAIAYGASLSLWQKRLVQQADAFVVPSEFALRRLRELGAPLPFDRVHVLPPPVEPVKALAGREEEAAAAGADAGAPVGEIRSPVGDVGAPAPAGAGARTERRYALVVSRLAPEKGVDVAIDACLVAGKPLLVAGDGPQRQALEARVKAAGAPPSAVRFLGAVSAAELSRLRRGAAIALVPSRSAETFGIAAAEAMAHGIPVVGSDVGALRELLPAHALVPPGDVDRLANAIGRLWGDLQEGERGRLVVAGLCAPEAVAGRLSEVYGAASIVGRLPRS